MNIPPSRSHNYRTAASLCQTNETCIHIDEVVACSDASSQMVILSAYSPDYVCGMVHNLVCWI